jgi:hypothetical protein
MTATLNDAIRVLNERKDALGIPDDGPDVERVTVTIKSEDPGPGEIDGRPLLVGFDVDVDELGAHAADMARDAAEAIVELGPGPTVAGAWLDGILTGLMLGELRAREAAERRLEETGPGPLVDPTVALNVHVRREAAGRVADALVTASRAGLTLAAASVRAADAVLEELVRRGRA